MNNGKYCPEIIKEICGHIARGSSQKDAAILSGICEDTFYDWLNKKPAFSEALKKAILKRKQTLANKIIQEKSWQSDAWMLERVHRSEFGRVDRHEVTGEDGKPMQFTFGIMKDRVDESSDKPKPKAE